MHNHFTRNHWPCLALHNPHNGFSLLVHGRFLDRFKTIPLSLLAPGAAMATAPQVLSRVPLTSQRWSLMWPVVLFSEWLPVSFSHSPAKEPSQEPSWLRLFESGDSCLVTHPTFIG